MRVRWTKTAADDLEKIVEFIKKDDHEAARRVAKTIFDAVAALRSHAGDASVWPRIPAS